MKEKVRTEVVLETRQGRTVSRKKDFFLNGNLYSEGTYSNALGRWEWDIPVGNIKHYNKDGTLKSDQQYDEHGERDGDTSFFNEKGKLLSKITYIKGKKITEVHFDELGNPKEPGTSSRRK